MVPPIWIAQAAADTTVEAPAWVEGIGALVALVVVGVPLALGVVALTKLVLAGMRSHDGERRLLERLERYFPDPDTADPRALEASVPHQLNELKAGQARAAEEVAQLRTEGARLNDDLRRHMVEEADRLGQLEERTNNNAEAARRARQDFERHVMRRIEDTRSQLLATVAAATGVVPPVDTTPAAHHHPEDPHDHPVTR